MRYKVGDTIKIRDGLDCHGISVGAMKKYAGSICKVTGIFSNEYYLDVDVEYWSWCDECIDHSYTEKTKLTDFPKYWFIKNDYQDVREYLAETYEHPNAEYWDSYKYIGYDGIASCKGLHGCLKDSFLNDAVEITYAQFEEFTAQSKGKACKDWFQGPGWYISDSNTNWLTYFKSKSEGFGFNCEGGWFEFNTKRMSDGFVPAPSEYVEERLVEYAKKYKGENFKPIVGRYVGTDTVITAYTSDPWFSYEQVWIYTDDGNYTIYEDGKWAEITKDPAYMSDMSTKSKPSPPTHLFGKSISYSAEITKELFNELLAKLRSYDWGDKIEYDLSVNDFEDFERYEFFWIMPKVGNGTYSFGVDNNRQASEGTTIWKLLGKDEPKKTDSPLYPVGSQVVVDDDYLGKYNKMEFSNIPVEIITVSYHVPSHCVTVDISYNAEGGLNVPIDKLRLPTEECNMCSGSGETMVGKLYPSGHTEVMEECPNCEGLGEIESHIPEPKQSDVPEYEELKSPEVGLLKVKRI